MVTGEHLTQKTRRRSITSSRCCSMELSSAIRSSSCDRFITSGTRFGPACRRPCSTGCVDHRHPTCRSTTTPICWRAIAGGDAYRQQCGERIRISGRCSSEQGWVGRELASNTARIRQDWSPNRSRVLTSICRLTAVRTGAPLHARACMDLSIASFLATLSLMRMISQLRLVSRC